MKMNAMLLACRDERYGARDGPGRDEARALIFKDQGKAMARGLAQLWAQGKTQLLGAQPRPSDSILDEQRSLLVKHAHKLATKLYIEAGARARDRAPSFAIPDQVTLILFVPLLLRFTFAFLGTCLDFRRRS